MTTPETTTPEVSTADSLAALKESLERDPSPENFAEVMKARGDTLSDLIAEGHMHSDAEVLARIPAFIGDELTGALFLAS